MWSNFIAAVPGSAFMKQCPQFLYRTKAEQLSVVNVANSARLVATTGERSAVARNGIRQHPQNPRMVRNLSAFGERIGWNFTGFGSSLCAAGTRHKGAGARTRFRPGHGRASDHAEASWTKWGWRAAAGSERQRTHARRLHQRHRRRDPRKRHHQRRAGRQLQHLGRRREREARGRPARSRCKRSDTDFIEYASGVRKRQVLVRDGILDPERMAPRMPRRGDDELSVMAEFGVASARKALARRRRRGRRRRPGDLRGLAPAAALSGDRASRCRRSWARRVRPST